MTLQVLLNILGMVTIISVLFYMQKKVRLFFQTGVYRIGLGDCIWPLIAICLWIRV